jgi:AcrR family transcriptional regulator
MSIPRGILTPVTRLTRSERRSRTREQLLDAAERVFARQGFHGASLDAIAGEAGFTKGAVYSNFPGKDALFLALLDRRRARIEAQLAAPDAGVVEVLADGAAEPPREDAWNLLTLEFFLYAVREDLYATTRRALAAGLERGASGSRPLDLTATELATVALALSTGIGVQAALDPDAVPPDLYPRVVAGLAGVRPGPPPTGD